MSDIPSLTYQSTLPLSWHSVDMPSAAAIVQARHANIALLKALATLEAGPEKDHDADPAIAKAVERLEAKLDIALHLLCSLVTQYAALPDALSVTLSANQLLWTPSATQNLPTAGATLLLTLCLSPRLPQALQLYARVTHADTRSCSAVFLDDDAEFEEWITRTLFRYHRRALQSRHHA